MLQLIFLNFKTFPANRVFFFYRYNDLTKELKLNITSACDRLIMNFDHEFDTVPRVRNRETGRTRSSFFCDFDSSLETNSLNQVCTGLNNISS